MHLLPIPPSNKQPLQWNIVLFLDGKIIYKSLNFMFFFRPSHPLRLLPTDGTLSNVLGRCESLVELTLVVRAEEFRPQIPPGS